MSFSDALTFLFVFLMVFSIAYLKLLLIKQTKKCNELQNELATRVRLSKDEQIGMLKEKIHQLTNECSEIRTRYQNEIDNNSSTRKAILDRNAEISRWQTDYGKSNKYAKQLQLEINELKEAHKAECKEKEKENEELLDLVDTFIDVTQMFISSSSNYRLASNSYDFITSVVEVWLPSKSLFTKEELNIKKFKGNGNNPYAEDNLSGLQHVDGTWVVGHYRNGSWVEGHYRSAHTRYR